MGDEERADRLAEAAFLLVHDLDEPLREVRGFAELLERRAGERLAPEHEELLAHVLAGARRAQGLLEGLAAYVRAERAPLDPRAVAVGELLAPVEGAEHAVRGDPELLADLFERLLDNARRFGDGGEVAAAAERAGDEVVVSVADEGPGIPAGEHERVLRLFARAHPRDEYPGAGVGLAVAAAIAARHGGRLWLESRSPRGTVARVALPAA